MGIAAVLRRFPFVRHLAVRPRLASAVAAAAAVYLILPVVRPLPGIGRLLLAYDAGVLLYLVLAGAMMVGSSHARIRNRARVEDEGQLAILVAVVLASGASLVAIAAHLVAAKELSGMARLEHIVLAAVTVVLSWAFTQVMFAIHYAHAYYAGSGDARAGGLAFPETGDPTYLDFLYVACVVGTSGQTADVAYTTSGMRLVGLVHCVQAFFFNASLLALGINMIAGLL